LSDFGGDRAGLSVGELHNRPGPGSIGKGGL